MTAAPAVVLALLLSGCTANDDTDANPLFGWCPQWVQGPGSHPVNLYISDVNAENETDSRILHPPGISFSGNGTPDVFQGRPLDLYRITLDRINATGNVELRAFDQDGIQLGIRDYRHQDDAVQVVPLAIVAADDAGAHFDVALTSVSHDDRANPGSLRVRWTMADGGAAVIAYTATYHYKVCGAQV